MIMADMQTRRRSTRVYGQTDSDNLARVQLVFFGVLFVLFAIVARLFFLMVLHPITGTRERFLQLAPNRGEVFIQDSRTKEEYPLAINQDVFTVFSDTREIQDDKTAERVAVAVADFFDYSDEEQLALYYRLNKRDDPYEPIEQRVSEDDAVALLDMELTGIHALREPFRFYPEYDLASQVIGFVGKDDEGGTVGRYGVEGYWQELLAGKQGFFSGAQSARGREIPLAGQEFLPEEDGADLLLTIDRTLQYKTCAMLAEMKEYYEAITATVIVMDPKTGAVRVMCSLPTFDPNEYNRVEDIAVYNNSTIFTAYEPGSIFKPLVVSMALNEELITPNTSFHDTGKVEDLCQKPIRNADGKDYGDTTMTGVLENSINTGMVHIAQLLKKKRMKSYLEDYGFGIKQGISLNTEVAGTIESLSRNSLDRFDCYAATASFGQGLTVTPLQMVTAFSAIANNGVLMKPYVVEEIRHANGNIEKTRPEEIRQVISERAASLTKGMMVSVIDNGQASAARVPGYYVAGKTGTAQIPGPGGYTADTNQSFIGFAPADDPAFVMLVKFEKPNRPFSSMTAAPTFARLAQFMLQYYDIPPERPIE